MIHCHFINEIQYDKKLSKVDDCRAIIGKSQAIIIIDKLQKAISAKEDFFIVYVNQS